MDDEWLVKIRIEADEATPANANLETNSVEQADPLLKTKTAKNPPPIRNIGGTMATTTNGMVEINANIAVEGTRVRIAGNSQKTRTTVLSGGRVPKIKRISRMANPNAVKAITTKRK
jgi:hypothetical protein